MFKANILKLSYKNLLLRLLKLNKIEKHLCKITLNNSHKKYNLLTKSVLMIHKNTSPAIKNVNT